ncbi:MAG TPA: DUF938 domain-containing protein [Acidiferrobacteraceae bacterium]|nr:DUF938 domain-containing protein [Acidiferrobacteraceae bacterium]
MKQYTPACDRNSEHILSVLKSIFIHPGKVLEIGSGTGQHAVYFSRGLPHLSWIPSDVPDQLDSITAWRDEADHDNLQAPVGLDLFDTHWPVEQVDHIVCINTIHIVPWKAVEHLFAGVARVLNQGGFLYVYGPYRYSDRPLEPSNEKFDLWLKERDPRSGIRDIGAVDALAKTSGLKLVGDQSMPANNRSIWWHKL